MDPHFPRTYPRDRKRQAPLIMLLPQGTSATASVHAGVECLLLELKL